MIKIPIIVLRENPQLVRNLETASYDRTEAAALKQKLVKKRTLFCVLMVLCLAVILFVTCVLSYLEEHFGFSVPPSVYVTSLLLFLPDLYFLNQFFVYKRLLEALERGYPSL